MNPSKLRAMIVDLTGEEPEDMFGPDWEQYAEEFIEEHNKEVFVDKYGG